MRCNFHGRCPLGEIMFICARHFYPQVSLTHFHTFFMSELVSVSPKYVEKRKLISLIYKQTGAKLS